MLTLTGGAPTPQIRRPISAETAAIAARDPAEDLDTLTQYPFSQGLAALTSLKGTLSLRVYIFTDEVCVGPDRRPVERLDAFARLGYSLTWHRRPWGLPTLR